MFSDVDLAAEGLRQANQELDEAALASGRVGHYDRIRVAESGVDILEVISIFRAVHLEAVMAHSEQTRLLASQLVTPDLRTALDGSPEDLRQYFASLSPQDMQQRFASIERGYGLTREPSARLKVAYKALFLFIRAYQDAVFRVLKSLYGEHAAKPATMSAALRARNRVGDLLRERFPEYLPWFEEWRARQNRSSIECAGLSDAGCTVPSGFREGPAASARSWPPVFRTR